MGIRIIGDGTFLDRQGNELANFHAKAAAVDTRAPQDVRKAFFDFQGLVKDNAKWIAKAALAANSQPTSPRRDSEASRRTAAKNCRHLVADPKISLRQKLICT